MISRRYGTFAGGIELPDEKQATLDKPIRRCDQPSRLRIPLAPAGGAEALPIVQPGQTVVAGEKIAVAAGAGGLDIFTGLGGRVAAIAMADLVTQQGLRTSQAIELTDLSAGGELQPASPVFDWQTADGEELLARLGDGGLVTHRRPSEPLTRWIKAAREKNCRVLIANVMENSPHVTADHRLLIEHGGQVIEGLAILAGVIGVEEVFFVADQRRTDDYRRLIGPARAFGINRIALPHKYPIGADAILVKVLTRREVAPGSGVMDVQAAVIDAATCFAVYRWAVCGVRPVGRVVTVAGERAERPGNFYVPFGAGCMELVGSAERSVIHGGPMTGLVCSAETVVGPATNMLLAIEPPTASLPAPCIRCGWCSDHCPARLNVAMLNDAFELGLLDRAHKNGVLACVECGVCSYVCPARLPLGQRVKQLKQTIRFMDKNMPLFVKR
ncbi:MAG: 4Fe-4S dicluster domain-containing protein [Planctomycetota bacterium]|nr:4Fe-4S dicluster domain-containing protein [Planctomycetota bacterium]